jgi:UDP-GlcNAc:undecaprenyl-phosphate GlcNAc-1-phosphate transferase
MLEGSLLIVLYIGVGIVLLKGVIQFLLDHGISAENYKSRKIPIGLGLYLWVMLLVYFLMLRITNFGGIGEWTSLYTYIMALTVIVFIGWMDDTIGDKQVKGFSGHWRKWKIEGILTTGLLKAAVTGFMALWLVVEFGYGLIQGTVQFFLILLMTNAINLFDLRPGRSLKVFFLLTAALLIVGSWQQLMIYLFPVVIAAILLFPGDLRAQVMLGDTGANFLGFALGFCTAAASPLWFQMAILGLLIWIHWIAGYKSITVMVENNSVLNWLDRWGRRLNN